VCLFIYTDGARKDGDGAWAFVAVLNGREVHRESGKVVGTTNNRMELTAILKALAFAQQYGHVDNVIIVTDSQYSIRVIKQPGRCTVAGALRKNYDLIRQCKSLVTERIKFEWVKGHSGNEWNEFADKLATLAVRRGMPANAVFKPRKRPVSPLSLYGTGDRPNVP
jgi:DNA polymerase-1